MGFKKFNRAEKSDVEVVTDTTPGHEKTAKVGELTEEQKRELRRSSNTEDQ